MKKILIWVVGFIMVASLAYSAQQTPVIGDTFGEAMGKLDNNDDDFYAFYGSSTIWQAYDADLTTYAGITPSANVQSLLGAATYAAMLELLGLEVGVDIQAYDVDTAKKDENNIWTGTQAFQNSTFTFGVNDTTQGMAALYGGSTVNSSLAMYNAADADTTLEYWVLAPNDTDFYLGNSSIVDLFTFSNAGDLNLVSVTASGDVTAGRLIIPQSTNASYTKWWAASADGAYGHTVTTATLTADRQSYIPDYVFELPNAGMVNSTGGISDLAIASQVAGDILYFNGTNWIRLAKGTAAQVLKMNTGATAPEWGTDSTGTGWDKDATETLTNKTIDGDDNTLQDIPVSAIKDLYAYQEIPIAWMNGGTSAPDALDTDTRDPYAYRTFADDADEDLNFVWVVPADLSGTTIQYRVYYLVTEATGPSAEGVAFGLSGASLGDNDATNGTKGTVVVITDPTITAAQHDVLITGWSGDVTVTNLLAGEVAELAFIRDVSDTADDYAQDVGVFMIQIRYVQNPVR